MGRESLDALAANHNSKYLMVVHAKIAIHPTYREGASEQIAMKLQQKETRSLTNQRTCAGAKHRKISRCRELADAGHRQSHSV